MPSMTRDLRHSCREFHVISNRQMSAAATAKQCPWCERWCLKDDACNYIFACGLQAGTERFVVGTGCGRPWCWQCGKKFCGIYIDPCTGKKSDGRTSHGSECCKSDPAYEKSAFCPGGHNSHCEPR